MSFIDVPQLNVYPFIMPNARVCIISDFRYNEDIEHARPFSESEVSLITQCLSSVGYSVTSCSILHAITSPCSQINLPRYWTPKGGFTVEGAAEIQELRRTLESLEPAPNVLVLLGEISLQALTTQRGITKWRGSILYADKLNRHMKCVPTISPKTAIKQYMYRYYIQADFKKAFNESDYPEVIYPKRILRVSPTFDEVMAYLDEVSKCAVTSVDIETARNEVSCIAFTLSESDAMCIPFYNYWSEDEEIAIWLKIASILENPNIGKVFQNGMFDMFFLLMRNKIYTRGYIHDTMLKHNLNYPDFPKSLAFLTSIYTNERYYKDDGKKWFEELKGGTAEDLNGFYIYNAKDAAVTQEVDRTVSAELLKYGNQETYEISRRLMEPLLYMQYKGIRVNMDALTKCKNEAHSQLADLQKQLNELCGFELNVNSPKQCIKYFYSTKGYPAVTSKKKDPKTGERKVSISADDKAMRKLVKKYQCPEARLVQQIRSIRKMISTYFELQLDKDGRLRCSYNIAGTNTGRLSSSETCFGTGQNLQNLPKSFRMFLCADEGYLAIEVDLTQAEWVGTAYICGDGNMIKAVEDRLDAHIHTGHLMFGVPKDLIAKEHELLGSESDEEVIKEKRKENIPDIFKYHPLVDMSIRQGGKKSNHSFNYGLSPNGFSLQYGMELKDAKRCFNLYHNAYPNIRVWHQHVRYQLGKNRTLENLFGRKRRFLNRWNEDLFKAAYSYNPQSSIAQLLNLCLIDIYEKQREIEALRWAQLLNQVHDSVWVQYPIAKLDQLPEFLKFVQSSLQRPLHVHGRDFFIRCDCKIGFNFKQLDEIDLDLPSDELKNKIQGIINKYTTKQDTSVLDLISEEPDEESEVEDEDLQ